jgi:16S rRNA (adenine(1408)-N(1))-methyltransferase
MKKVSEKNHRKPENGRLPNVLFVQTPGRRASVEANQVADEIQHSFPWGNLLRSVAIGDKEVLGGLRRMAVPGAWLEIIMGSTRAETRPRRRGWSCVLDGGVCPLDVDTRYEMAGFKVEESGISSDAEWPHIEMTWAKRLGDNSRRQLLLIIAKATS